MRNSIAIVATLVVGASATTVGAYSVPATYFGSDTLFLVTQDAIGETPGLGASLESNYLAGGTGTGQNTMAAASAAAALQQTSPMTKMMSNGVCNALGGVNGNLATNASGVVIGLDAVTLLSASVSGGAAACNGASDSASADGTGFGAAYSGTVGVFSGSNAKQNWKWVLALLYGGLDLSPGAPASPDCNSTARQNLVSNWSLLFQTGCSNAASICQDAAHKAGGSTAALWHAFRRDDASGTSDVFSSLIGLQTWLGGGQNAATYNGFGITPYCNALNWDANVVTNGNGTSVTCAGTAGPHDQFVGPGGVVDPSSKCTFTDFKAADLKVAETCGAAGSGNHRMPPASAYGTAPDPNVGGVGNAPAAWDVLPTGFQDNDPIRRTCLGNSTGNPLSEAEEVCNIDGRLGVVLAIPATDFLPSTTNHPVQYPSNQCSGTYYEGLAPNILSCAPKGTTAHSGQCPNGDALFSGNQCETPVDDSTSNVTSQCLNNKSPSASIIVRGISTDGRVHNLAMYDGTVAGQQPVFIHQTIQNGKTTPPKVDFVGGMGRIHTVATIYDKTKGKPTNVGCQYGDVSDQMACLVQADPCSVAYGSIDPTFSERANGACAYLASAVGGNLCTVAGSGYSGASCPAACLAVGTTSAALVSESVRIDQDYPNAAAVLALGKQANEYQIGRKLYFNSLVGFSAITGTTGDPGALGELALAEFESNEANIGPLLASVGFFPLAGSQTATGNDAAGVPLSVFNQPFCEDFDEQTVCNPTSTTSALPANVNACPGNASAPIEYAAAGSIAAATAPPTQGSICGDGNLDPFEECDNGLNNGTSGNACSVTCRCSGTTSFENTGDGNGWHCQ
jgi:hypothetical protein